MNEHLDPGTSASDKSLRQRAEERLKATPPYSGRIYSQPEILRELHTHQIELEIQNEELRRAQVSLAASQARYFELYDLAPVGYLTLCEKGLILEPNLTAAATLGVIKSALLNRPLTSFIHAEDQDLWYLHHKRLLETREAQVCELRMMKHDGATFWARLDAAAAQRGEAAPVCRVMLSDISVRKRAEEALRESERFAHATLDSLSAHIAVLDQTGTIVAVNRAWRAFAEANLPLSSRVNEGANYLTVCDAAKGPDSAEAAAVAVGIRAVLAGALNTFEIEYACHSPDTKRWFICQASRFPNPGVTRVVVAHQDITSRKQTEAAREMTREALQILNEPGDFQDSIEHLLILLKARTGFDAVGIRLQDGDDFPYFAQKGFPADFLLTENTLIERGVDGGVCRDKDGNVKLECTCGLVISSKTDPAHPLFTPGGSFWTNDSVPLLDLPPEKDPRRRPRNRCIHDGYASIALVPIRNEARVVGLIHLNDRRKGRFTLETIQLLEEIAARVGTALMRKQAEAEISRLNADLERRVAERTAQLNDTVQRLRREIAERTLVEQEFLESQKMEALGQLAAGIAHDFNNQLCVILGNADAIASGARDNLLRKQAQHILRGAERSATLTDQLLAFSRRGQYIAQPVDLHALLGETLAVLRRSLKKTIQLRDEFRADRSVVQGDQGLLENAFFNLALNARDAMPDGGELTFATAVVNLTDPPPGSMGTEWVPGPYLCVSVRDTGHGMSEETRGRIFKPFFTTKGPGKGTGLGLASVLATITRHQGRIEVASQEGAGTTFRVYLPIAPRQDPPAHKEHAPRSTADRHVTGSILLAEDEEGIRDLLLRELRNRGHRVIAKEDGQKAVEHYRQHWKSVDLVILDMNMPGLTGLEVMKALQKVNPKLRAILSSGLNEENEYQRAVHLGAVGFLKKPFRLDELVSAVDRAILG